MSDNCPASHRDDRERSSAPGLRLCLGCRRRLEVSVTALPALDLDLELALIHGEAPAGDPITHRKDPGLVINQAALEARTLMRHQLVAQVRMINEEQGLTTWPADTVPAMVAHVARHFDWLARHDAAEVWVEEWADVRSQARRAAFPSGVRRFDLAPCIEVDCVGTLVAVLRRSDDLLPSAVTCNAEVTHVWESHEWMALGRRIHASGYTALLRQVGGLA